MAELSETHLPGVGERLEFVSEAGNRVGVVHHRTGQRELFVCSPSDPDAVAMSVDLTDEESHALADALGGPSIVEAMSGLTKRVKGLAIDWLEITDGTPFVGRTIGDAEVRTRTGVSIVAVVRDGIAHPAPGPDFHIEDGDVAVVVGTPAGIEATRDILTTD